VEVDAERARGRLTVTVLDDGVGLPPGLDPDSTDRLGLQIVRTLVGAELGGSLDLHSRTDGTRGTRAAVCLPLGGRERTA
jgi:two-component sensor histidine kinase